MALAGGGGGDRPAVPVPSVGVPSTTPPHSSSSTSPPLRAQLGSAAGAPTDMNMKPKPRTGTGMTYKTSASKMRAPMQLASSAAATSVGRAPGTRAIAL